jgi:copper transport protein
MKARPADRGWRLRLCPAALLAASLIGGGTLLMPAVAEGHAALLAADPQPGLRVDRPPAQVRLRFSEPLNLSLSHARINDAAGHAIGARLRFADRRTIVLLPDERLARTAAIVEWHTVSATDGHTLDGAYSFGVGVAASPAPSSTQTSVLGGLGAVRIVARTLLYLGLLGLLGGLALERLLGRCWLAPASLERGCPRQTARVRARERALGDTAGAIAVIGAAGVAGFDTLQATGSLRPAGLSSYLLEGVTGPARLAVIGLLLIAWRLQRRSRLASLAAAVLAALALSLSGHAVSASIPALAISIDFLHVVSASVWLGGLLWLVACWGGELRSLELATRTLLARDVVAPFGRVALAAFSATLMSGLLNAVIEVDNPAQLVTTSYGRVLLAKLAFVATAGVIAWRHAATLRARLIVGQAGRRGERRYWRLIRAETLPGVAAVCSAAALVAFPLPPQQASALGAVAPPAVCDNCPPPLPAPDELAVADHLGPYAIASWIRRSHDRLTGQLRLIDADNRPVNAALRVRGGVVAPCGPGCSRFVAASAPALRVGLDRGSQHFSAALPAVWQARRSREAGRLLALAEGAMRDVGSARMFETITSGPNTWGSTLYYLQAPDRQEYQTNLGYRVVVVGSREWVSQPGVHPVAQPYGDGLAFRTRGFFRWSPFAPVVRLLRRDRQTADLAFVDPSGPVWVRLRVRLRGYRVTRVWEVSPGEFLQDRIYAVNRPLQIRVP